jgi:putative FmdB family regulatory protein
LEKILTQDLFRGMAMPIYEYDCRKCRESFAVIKSSKTQNVKCPKCGSDDIKKKISACSTFSHGGCGGGQTGNFGGG